MARRTIQDSFTKADGNLAGTKPDAGTTFWENVSGTWTIASGKATNTAGGQKIAAIESRASDGYVQADVTLPASGADGGLIARCKDDDNYLLFGALGYTSTAVWTKIAGSYANIANWGYGAITGTHNFRFTFSGKSLQGFLDGVSIGTYTLSDSEMTALGNNTKVGIREHTGGATATLYDNFRASAASNSVGGIRNPKRYHEKVQRDNPQGYWRFEDQTEMITTQNSRDAEVTVGEWIANGGMGTVARSTEQAHTGVGSIKAISNGASNQGVYHNTALVMGPNDTFTFSVWIYGSFNRQIVLYTYFYQDGGFQSSNGLSLGFVKPGWSRYEFTWTNPNAAWNGFRPAIHFDGDLGLSGEYFYFDDASVIYRGGPHASSGVLAKYMTLAAGTPNYAAGKYGWGPVFAASSHYRQAVETDFAFNTGTVEAWVKTTGAGVSYRAIVAKGNAYGIFMVNDVLSTYDWGAATPRSTDIEIDDGAWHHVAMTFQSGVANGTKLYLDGRLVLTTQITVANQNTILEIGENTGAGQLFTGNIDEVAVYDYVLSAEQIRSRVPNQYLAYDNFNRADSDTLGSTPWGGYAWVEGGDRGISSPDADILSNQLRVVSQCIPYIDIGKLNQDVECTVDNAGYPVVRYADENNFICAGHDNASSTLQLYKIVGGTASSIGNFASTNADGHVIRLKVEGDALTVWLNGTQRITGTITDAILRTGTKVGFLAIAGRDCDEFKVYP